MIQLPYTDDNIRIVQQFLKETSNRIAKGVGITFTVKVNTELQDLMLEYDITITVVCNCNFLNRKLIMTPITIPFHFLIPILVSTLSLLITFKFKDNLTKSQLIGISTFFISYILFLGLVTYDDIYSQWHLNQFDIDKDGFFSQEEQTPDQKAAMFDLTNDVGRNFAVFTTLIVSGLFGFLIFLTNWIYQKLFK